MILPFHQYLEVAIQSPVNVRARKKLKEKNLKSKIGTTAPYFLQFKLFKIGSFFKHCEEIIPIFRAVSNSRCEIYLSRISGDRKSDPTQSNMER